MSAGAEVTSTCELTVPTRKTGLMLSTCPSAVAMSLTTVVSKPGLVTVTRKMPSGNWGKLNCPLASLVSVRSCPVEGFTSLTVAPGTEAPWVSWTVPVIRPGKSWAEEVNAQAKIKNTMAETKREAKTLFKAASKMRPRVSRRIHATLEICQQHFICISLVHDKCVDRLAAGAGYRGP